MSIINELVNSVLDSKNAFEIIDILVKKIVVNPPEGLLDVTN